MLLLFIFLIWILLILVMTPSLMNKVVEKMPSSLLNLPTDTLFFCILGIGLLGSGVVIGKFVLNAEESNIQRQCCSILEGTFAPISGECTGPSSEAKEREDYPTCIDRVSKLNECCHTVEGQFSLISDQCVIQENEEVSDKEKSEKYADCSGDELSIISKKPVVVDNNVATETDTKKTPEPEDTKPSKPSSEEAAAPDASKKDAKSKD
tara:strand:+ start:142 stop:765 length:624 start_codon:yes stop_codon:yes gene_type:complete